MMQILRGSLVSGVGDSHVSFVLILVPIMKPGMLAFLTNSGARHGLQPVSVRPPAASTAYLMASADR